MNIKKWLSWLLFFFVMSIIAFQRKAVALSLYMMFIGVGLLTTPLLILAPNLFIWGSVLFVVGLIGQICSASKRTIFLARCACLLAPLLFIPYQWNLKAEDILAKKLQPDIPWQGSLSAIKSLALLSDMPVGARINDIDDSCGQICERLFYQNTSIRSISVGLLSSTSPEWNEFTKVKHFYIEKGAACPETKNENNDLLKRLSSNGECLVSEEAILGHPDVVIVKRGIGKRWGPIIEDKMISFNWDYENNIIEGWNLALYLSNENGLEKVFYKNFDAGINEAIVPFIILPVGGMAEHMSTGRFEKWKSSGSAYALRYQGLWEGVEYIPGLGGSGQAIQ